MSVGVHQSARSLLAELASMSAGYSDWGASSIATLATALSSAQTTDHQTTDCATTLDPVVEHAVQTCAGLPVFIVSVLLLRKSVIFAVAYRSVSSVTKYSWRNGLKSAEERDNMHGLETYLLSISRQRLFAMRISSSSFWMRASTDVS